MVFNIEKEPKYEKSIKYIIRNGFHNILNKVQQIEETLENGSWLQKDVKNQYKIERLYDNQGNLWKCKYIHNWRLVFRVVDNTIRLIDLDRRDSIYTNFLIL